MQCFKDQDREYLQWRWANPKGFIVNCARNPGPSYLLLHRVSCPTLAKLSSKAKCWTKDYIKVCSLDRTELERWARDKIRGTLKPCQFCNP
jgi:hypothetical protein